MGSANRLALWTESLLFISEKLRASDKQGSPRGCAPIPGAGQLGEESLTGLFSLGPDSDLACSLVPRELINLALTEGGWEGPSASARPPAGLQEPNCSFSAGNADVLLHLRSTSVCPHPTRAGPGSGTSTGLWLQSEGKSGSIRERLKWGPGGGFKSQWVSPSPLWNPQSPLTLTRGGGTDGASEPPFSPPLRLFALLCLLRVTGVLSACSPLLSGVLEPNSRDRKLWVKEMEALDGKAN